MMRRVRFQLSALLAMTLVAGIMLGLNVRTKKSFIHPPPSACLDYEIHERGWPLPLSEDVFTIPRKLVDGEFTAGDPGRKFGGGAEWNQTGICVDIFTVLIAVISAGALTQWISVRKKAAPVPIQTTVV